MNNAGDEIFYFLQTAWFQTGYYNILYLHCMASKFMYLKIRLFSVNRINQLNCKARNLPWHSTGSGELV